MDFLNMVDCRVDAKSRYRSSFDLEIESVRFDKESKAKLKNILETKVPNSENVVLRISCLFISPDNFVKLKRFGRYSAKFFPEGNAPFRLHDFDLHYRDNKVIDYNSYIEVSDVSMIIYSV